MLKKKQKMMLIELLVVEMPTKTVVDFVVALQVHRSFSLPQHTSAPTHDTSMAHSAFLVLKHGLFE